MSKLTFLKRINTFFVSVMMLISVMQVQAFSASVTVYDYTLNFQNGKIYKEFTNEEVTSLSGCSWTGDTIVFENFNFSTTGGDSQIAVQLPSDVKVVLKGTNKITLAEGSGSMVGIGAKGISSDGDITFEGDGSLEVTICDGKSETGLKDGEGYCISASNITINGSNITAVSGSDYMVSAGVYTGENLTINDGTLTVNGKNCQITNGIYVGGRLDIISGKIAAFVESSSADDTVSAAYIGKEPYITAKQKSGSEYIVDVEWDETSNNLIRSDNGSYADDVELTPIVEDYDFTAKFEFGVADKMYKSNLGTEVKTLRGWEFDGDTLTLENFDFETTASASDDFSGRLIGMDLTNVSKVILKGENRITVSSDIGNRDIYGIYTNSSLTFEGDGSLIVTAKGYTKTSKAGKSYGIYTAENCNFVVKTADVSAVAKASSTLNCGLYAGGGVEFDSGGRLFATADTSNADAENYAAYVDYCPEYVARQNVDGEYINYQTLIDYNGYFVDKNDNEIIATDIEVVDKQPFYDFPLTFKKGTANKAFNLITGEEVRNVGGWLWDGSVLTLDDFDFSVGVGDTDAYMAVELPENTKVILKNNNKIDLSGYGTVESANALYAKGDIEFEGDGNLDITASIIENTQNNGEFCGLYCMGNVNLNGGTIKVNAKSYGGSCYGLKVDNTINITDGEIIAAAEDSISGRYAVYVKEEPNVSAKAGSSPIYEIPVKWKDGCYYEGEQKVYELKLTVPEKVIDYTLTFEKGVADKAFNRATGEEVTDINGWLWDGSTLTLENFNFSTSGEAEDTSNTLSAVELPEDTKVILKGENKITLTNDIAEQTSYNIIGLNCIGNVTFEGDGSLTITGGGDCASEDFVGFSIGFLSQGDVTVNGGNITVKPGNGFNNCIGFKAASVTMNDGYLNIIADSAIRIREGFDVTNLLTMNGGKINSFTGEGAETYSVAFYTRNEPYASVKCKYGTDNKYVSYIEYNNAYHCYVIEGTEIFGNDVEITPYEECKDYTLYIKDNKAYKYQTGKELTELEGLQWQEGKLVLENFKFQTTAPTAVIIADDIEIVLKGENIIAVTDKEGYEFTYATGIEGEGNITFDGDGSLNVSVCDSIENADGYGYGIKLAGSLTINNGNVYAECGKNYIGGYGIYVNDSVIAKGGTLTGMSKECADASVGMFIPGHIELSGGKLIGSFEGDKNKTSNLTFCIFTLPVSVWARQKTSEGYTQDTKYDAYARYITEDTEEVADNVELSAKYIINASAREGGSISPSGETELHWGDNASFEFIPDIGYEIDKVLIDDIEVTVSENRFEFEKINADHKIEVTFKPITYTLTVENGSGSGEYGKGDLVWIVADESENGRIFDKWTADGIDLENKDKDIISFEMPDNDVKITAQYREGEIILGDVDEDGYITATDAAMVFQFIWDYENSNIRIEKLADVNKDGMINEVDAEMVLNKALNCETEF